MIRIATIIGARPQFIKAAALSRTIRSTFSSEIEEILIHTGQHYDENMSGSFFRDLEIPEPAMNLGVRENDHGRQTGMMLGKIEEALLDLAPSLVVLYGDTNSTLAGALAASKLHIPVAHIEAGLRSFNKKMPEEINRIVCDHVSTLLFTPTETSTSNLSDEGLSVFNSPPWSIDNPGVFECGDIMIDNLVYLGGIIGDDISLLKELEVERGKYHLCTVHRDFNTDDPGRLEGIFRGLSRISSDSGDKIVVPLHPRTRKRMQKLPDKALREVSSSNIELIEPLPYKKMVTLEKFAGMIITDSGGIQKEAYYFNKPLIILRPETEWEEIVEAGAARLADADPSMISDAWRYFREHDLPPFVPFYGNGRTAEFICNIIIDYGHQG